MGAEQMLVEKEKSRVCGNPGSTLYNLEGGTNKKVPENRDLYTFQTMLLPAAFGCAFFGSTSF